MTNAPIRPASAAPARPGSPRQSPSRTLSIETPTAKPLCPRLVFYAVHGYGKTTLAANAPKPVILQARDEQGLDRLVSSGAVPADIGTAKIESWEHALDWLGWFADQDPRGRTLSLDSFGTFERLCHERVCERDFGGEWGEHGFTSYQKGFDVSVSEWIKLLGRLDKIHSRGATILLLGHSRTKLFQNPMGVNFDRYECDVHPKTWAVTSRWADGVFFGKFRTIVETASRNANIAKGKGKGIGADERVIYTQHRDAFDAKPYGHVPAEFSLSGNRAHSWNEIWAEITGQKGAS